MSKPRIQLRITKRQEGIITDRAKRLGVSVREIIRRVLDEYFPQQNTQQSH